MGIKKESQSVFKALLVCFGALFSLISPVGYVYSDDIDVFRFAKVEKPNILFVLDYSDSMKSAPGFGEKAPPGQSKLAIMKKAVNLVIDENIDSINAGIGPRFSEYGGGISWPISELSADASTVDYIIEPGQLTSAEVAKSIVNRTGMKNRTATVPALAEAAQYFRGGKVYNGLYGSASMDDFKPNQWRAGSLVYANNNPVAANPASYMPRNAFNAKTGWQGARYKTPISNVCQANYIILISDGNPTVSGNIDAIEQQIKRPFDSCQDLSTSIFKDVPTVNHRTGGNCGPEVVRQMATRNQVAGISHSKVSTHTVGFGIGKYGEDYLKLLAQAGNGDYYNANSPQELSASLRSVIDSVKPEAQSFAELSIDVSRATFSHDNRAYLPLFTPSDRGSWVGNVKGYFLDENGLKDVNGIDATVNDDDGTHFVKSAQSFWSNSADGEVVALGGASEKLPTTMRNLYTYLGPVSGLGSSGVLLTNKEHSLSASNNKIPNQPFGGIAKRKALLTWLREQPMADSLHSKVVPVNYEGDRRVLYAMSNQGFIHAIDASFPTSNGFGDTSGGQELFAFMPKVLLANIKYLKNGRQDEEHVYGLDGQITPWHDDENGDGIVNNNDQVMLIFGMRRGGKNYYALNVTDPERPKFMWQISGGTGDFKRLAQTWSRPSLISVNRGGQKQRVLVFAGGYDNELDDRTKAMPSSGNAIFMVDRFGRYVWSADHYAMNYSIPANPVAIDSDSDGLADRLYIGDLGSQVWRVDFDDVNIGSDFKTTLLAALSGNEYRPFFYSPAVSASRGVASDYMSIAIGSGNRDNPLNDMNKNAIFMIKDPNVKKGAPTIHLSSITLLDLYNATANDVESSNYSIASAAKLAMKDQDGWYIELEKGEKSLSKVVVFNGKLLATTFSTNAAVANSTEDCIIPRPKFVSKYYVMDLATAKPGASESTDKTGRFTEIDHPSIPNSPSIIFNKNTTKTVVMVDKEVVSEISVSMNTVFWYGR